MYDKALPDWVKVGKKKFDRIKNQIQNAKNSNFQARPSLGVPISVNESRRLIQDIDHGKITHEETLKKIANIRNDIERIGNLDEFNQNQVNVLNALFMVDECFTGEFKWYKISDGKYKILKSKSDQKESDIAEQKSDIKVFKQQIQDQEKEIDKKLFQKYFEYQSQSEMLDDLFSLGNLQRNEVAKRLALILSIFLIKLKNRLKGLKKIKH